VLGPLRGNFIRAYALPYRYARFLGAAEAAKKILRWRDVWLKKSGL
jgi:hypothetical protein